MESQKGSIAIRTRDLETKDGMYAVSYVDAEMIQIGESIETSSRMRSATFQVVRWNDVSASQNRETGHLVS